MFYDPVRPAVFPRHLLRWRNQRAAGTVGLDSLTEAEWVAHFGRLEPLPQNLDPPLALRYHGHQFLSYNPRLGDGRGFLFGQLEATGGRLLDLGTKGSGTTPWSRGGDGRLTLKGAVREILAAELLEALGVDTCRILSVVETGEALFRNDEPSPTRSAVLVRLSHSHVRVGTFQRLAATGEREAMARLVDHCLAAYLPEARGPDPTLALFEAVVRRVAETAGAWMAAGFVHGVLNTDNINITGESFDYGPWRFLPEYDPDFTAAYFDETGLYRFSRQGWACAFTLEQLARSLALIAAPSALAPVLEAFGPAFDDAFARRFAWRMGLLPAPPEEDMALLQACLSFLEGIPLRYEQLFFDWYGGESSAERALAGATGRWYRMAQFAPVRELLGSRQARGGGDPALLAQEGPPSLHIDEVERIWAAIDQRDDWGPLHQRVDEIRALGAMLGTAPLPRPCRSLLDERAR